MTPRTDVSFMVGEREVNLGKTKSILPDFHIQTQDLFITGISSGKLSYRLDYNILVV